MHEPAPCCDSHQLPGQCGKQGPRVRFASPQATPLELKIPVQFLCSPWGGRRHCKSLVSTTADLPRQVPKWDILSETDYMCVALTQIISAQKLRASFVARSYTGYQSYVCT